MLQVSAQRDSITNFTTAQVTKLQNFSTDTTNLLTNCRDSVNDGVTKNITIAENISKLLDDWKLNNENMKTIAPMITESIESMNNATKDQIEQTQKVNEENQKLSDEQKSKLILINSDIKQQSETNRNEISKAIESVKNHTTIFAATLKSSKIKICEQFEKQKITAAAAFSKIESKIADGIENIKSNTADIANDIECVDKNLKEDARNNVSFKNNLSSIVVQFGTSSKKKLDGWRSVVSDFRKNDLKVYSSSGE